MRVFQSLAILLLLSVVSAQAQTFTSCPAAPAALNPTAPNMFNPQQETDLGDALAEVEDGHLRFIHDPAAEAYLEKIGQKLLAVLPPSNFIFSYKIVDSPEVNAYSIGGGHIYVTRKLIAGAANEDQLAGILGHEIGHILIHQQAIEFTDEFKDFLKVTAVGDRADIFQKVQQLRNANFHGAWHPFDQKDEESADAITIYALTKAGYQPGAFAEYWNQLAQTKGKTGSVVGDIFHTTHPDEQRLRAMLKVTAAVPSSCANAAGTDSAEFLAMRAKVVADPVSKSQIAADQNAVQLDPPLRSELTHVRFSPNGNFALAQDPTTIFVVSLAPVRLLFQIDADGAEAAQFSPDSKRISFNTPSLHVESWDVATGQLIGAHEVLTFHQGCMRHLLSPDGHALACVRNTSVGQNRQFGLTIWNVETGEKIVEKDDAFDLGTVINVSFGYGFTANANGSFVRDAKLRWPAVRMAFTPDGMRLIANREPTTLIYDLGEHKFMKAEGAVAKLNRRPFALVGSDRIVIDNWDDPEKSAEYSFPDGKELKRIAMGDQELSDVTKGDYVVLTPMKDAALGVLDLNTGQVPMSLPTAVLDINGDKALIESGEGGVAVTSQGLVAGAKGTATVDLPISDLAEITASAVSSDGKFLAISNNSRCAIWNTLTGDRVFHVRPFSTGFFDDSGIFYADLPKYRTQEHAQVAVDLNTRKASKLPYTPSEDARQVGSVLIEFKALDFAAKTELALDPKLAAKPGQSADQPPPQNLRQNTNLEVRDVKTNRVLWTRHFPHESPQILDGDPNELIMTWSKLYDGPGAEELKAHPELVAELKAIKMQMEGFLVEVFDARTGKYLRGVVADVRHDVLLRNTTNGFALLDAAPAPPTRAFGDFALVRAFNGTTFVNRFSTGARVGEVYGDILAGDAVSGLFCVSNRDNELIVYDAATARERKHFVYSSRISLASFLPTTKALMVLTAGQKVHMIHASDLEAASTIQPAAAQ